MISIVYSTHKDLDYNQKFKKHLESTVGLADVQILEYINKNEFSLSQIYNRGIQESNYDIVCCIHNDIKLEKDWGKKLLQDFTDNPDFAIIGKAGSCNFPKSGIYWEDMNLNMVGQVYHEPEGKKKWLSKYSPKLPFLIPVVTIDGLFISFNKLKIKHRFDETIGKFHFYDHGFCVPNFLDNIKIGVTSSFEITHNSIGAPNKEFFESKDLFVEKYKNSLPILLKPSKLYVPEIKDRPIKNIGKIAIIVLTKGKVEMLYDCVKSFYDHCNSDLFDFYIADTGSTDEEKNWIRENIIPFGNIKMIEYEYYNFAKVNNHIVKNYLNEKYEFLLFCNNDIKVLNNVIYNMIQVFKNNSKVGTVGCRLHYSDNLLQHGGIALYLNRESNLVITHSNLHSNYNYPTKTNKVLGNTAALLLIKKSTFEKCNMFNEKYLNCFEDVELNFECIVQGYDNYISGESVAYHYESQTRNENAENVNLQLHDYSTILYPYMIKNIKKLGLYIPNLNI